MLRHLRTGQPVHYWCQDETRLGLKTLTGKIIQPPSSPELNPIERLWEHIKSQLSWEYCPSLDQLRAKLKQVLNSISSEAIASICGWDYIISALFSATS
ncbi:hypothetical protein [Pleurocapsa sp. CCALA 161]|uniref:hypothetical protein n=1 Tax=Pleurocapsa sp. CCALA 161 TaxID=2107688 RepID=UPI0018ED7D60|nr:hypothetical protein [Pleurocapsa sp. CCALA 161]